MTGANSQNPWTARFDGIFDTSVIAKRVAVKPAACSGLDKLPPITAAGILSSALKQSYLPTENGCEIISTILQHMYSHCLQVYPNQKSYCAAISAPLDRNAIGSAKTLCLTGLSGVGKSELLKALQRVLPKGRVIRVGTQYDRIPLDAIWHVPLGTEKNLGKIMLPFSSTADAKEVNTVKSLEDLRLNIASRAKRDGVCLAMIDEMQFYSTSESAHAAATALLLYLASLGIPFIYGCNYSLVHKLHANRNQEDRTRLLQNPIVLTPDPPESTDWRKLLQEYKRISDGTLQYDILKDANELFLMTVGLKRALVSLLSEAYVLARARGKTIAGMEDIKAAYNTVAYSEYKNDIELMTTAMVTGMRPSKNRDLWCPYEVDRSANDRLQKMVEEARLKKATEAALQTSYTPAEKDALGLKKKGSKPKGEVVPFKQQRKKNTTAEELIQADQDFLNRDN